MSLLVQGRFHRNTPPLFNILLQIGSLISMYAIIITNRGGTIKNVAYIYRHLFSSGIICCMIAKCFKMQYVTTNRVIIIRVYCRLDFLSDVLYCGEPEKVPL